ncbi:AAA family ATPase [Aquicoccus porphyridii]|uniref:AAA family ATPase n=1 Tax=Aquicoccus porphyridii TaxID=1852029 RepID=A0A5A9YY09_9RHOB|nr:AAA family ATPase [Aquicoccus porphyridii]KAA0909739.1 AAA family ATPase [Aquicoccus porphyridii]RAI52007.1 ATPase [Rhodobacteraceae bacterium AsT-22]
MCEHMFVVTGGPGSGKTSLIDALTRRGFRSMPEAGRAIIQDQAQIGGTSLPWADRSMYAELMLGWELRSWHEAQAIDGPVLMDRGIADVVGYLTLCGLPVPAHIETAAKLYTYNRRVFLTPYWEAIFAQDAERKQDREEAQATGKVMAETYARFGYQLIEMPMTGVEERADLVAGFLEGV